MKKYATYLLAFYMASCMAFSLLHLSGCASVNRATYVATVGTRVSVETAMGYYDQLVAQGKVSLDDQKRVRTAYNQVRASMIALTDAGKAASAGSTTNSTGQNFDQVLAQLSADYNQNRADLFALLTSLGIKL